MYVCVDAMVAIANELTGWHAAARPSQPHLAENILTPSWAA